MRIKPARLLAIAVLVLGMSGPSRQANAEGADADTLQIDLQYCQSIPHGRVCFDITGEVHITVTPSGNITYVTHEQTCARAIQATPNGSLTYDDCRRFQENGLTKDGVLQVLGTHARGTFRRSLAGSTLTCSYRPAFHEVAGRIQVAGTDLTCSGSEIP